MSSAKEAMISFVDKLKINDRVSVVSFASEATNPIESFLTEDYSTAKKVIEEISILSTGTQYTNIFDALRSSWQELISGRAREEGVAKVAILLTDGVANNPRDPLGRTEEEDIIYAEKLALGEAQKMKADSINIFTIGLGGMINENFLTNLSSGSSNYYFASTSNALENIYDSISKNICKELPARIEITYRIFGSVI